MVRSWCTLQHYDLRIRTLLMPRNVLSLRSRYVQGCSGVQGCTVYIATRVMELGLRMES